jgi:hypothetical protein
MVNFESSLKRICRDVVVFSATASGRRLRSYQREVARAIVDSVVRDRGLTFVIIFPRQSGKNEVQAHIEAYLLTLYLAKGAELVKASPTWKPQTVNALRRLARVLSRNMLTNSRWKAESGYILRFGQAQITFLSGSATANVVGATANTLLECDEAQDVGIAKWDKDFAPMAASTNATRVFWGTAWTSRTLLAREKRAAEAAQAIDGVRRVWVLDADQVAAEVPAYGAFVAGQVARLGRNHPMVKTQYYSEEIDSEGGMFPPERIRLMQGAHPGREDPGGGRATRLYALTIDVAGEDEGLAELGALENTSRDSTAATVFEVDLSTLPADEKGAPTYRVMARYNWIGVKHTRLYNTLRELISRWNAQYVATDATGVGAGLASFLDKAFPGKLIPFQFTQQSKSKLGWGFLAIVETGRYQDNSDRHALNKRFWQQIRYTQHQVSEGPGKLLKWSVPDGTRDEVTGDLVHDDLVISAALCAVLDDQEWSMGGAPVIIERSDPLLEMDREGF